MRSKDCVYLWNEYTAIELSKVSNGWFRFLVDGKLSTMYSSGSTEGGPDSFGEITLNYYVLYIQWNLRIKDTFGDNINS